MHKFEKIKTATIASIFINSETLYFKHAVEAGFYLDLRQTGRNSISQCKALVKNGEYYLFDEMKHTMGDDIKTLAREQVYPIYFKSWEHEMSSAQNGDGPTVTVTEVHAAKHDTSDHMYIDEAGKCYQVREMPIQFTKPDPEYVSFEKPINDVLTTNALRRTETRNQQLRLIDQNRTERQRLEAEMRELEKESRKLEIERVSI